MSDGFDVVITGIGLISAAGPDAETVFDCLAGDPANWPRIDDQSIVPYPFYPMAELDLAEQIPRKSDQRQMGPWQHYGVYAAGLALEDAGIKGDLSLLGETNLIVAAGGGERDPVADAEVMAAVRGSNDPARALNEAMAINLRPTLFLAQLSNLLAGNISIVHHVTGSSKTFMGEELSGAMAMQVAMRRLQAGQGKVFLVGGAYNAARPDMMFLLELAHYPWTGDPKTSVWQRSKAGGGVIAGSMAAFLILEEAEHARARGARCYAHVDQVVADSGPREDEIRWQDRLDRLADAVQVADLDDLGVISGASGAEPATSAELGMLDRKFGSKNVPIRGIGTILGHGLEAQMPVGVALAALALNRKQFFGPFSQDPPEAGVDNPPRSIWATSIGHWRGESIVALSQP